VVIAAATLFVLARLVVALVTGNRPLLGVAALVAVVAVHFRHSHGRR
jgi:hypothetical protein